MYHCVIWETGLLECIRIVPSWWAYHKCDMEIHSSWVDPELPNGSPSLEISYCRVVHRSSWLDPELGSPSLETSHCYTGVHARSGNANIMCWCSGRCQLQTLDIWCYPHMFRRICTQWVMWSISWRPHLLPRTFPGTNFRLCQPGSPGQWKNAWL